MMRHAESGGLAVPCAAAQHDNMRLLQGCNGCRTVTWVRGQAVPALACRLEWACGRVQALRHTPAEVAVADIRCHVALQAGGESEEPLAKTGALSVDSAGVRARMHLPTTLHQHL